MTSESRDSQYLRCTWDGEPSTWNDFCRRVRLTFEQTPRRKRHLLAPRIESELTGRAWAITGHKELCRRDGVIYLLQYLKESLGRLPVPDIGVRLEALMLRLRRSPAQSMATWAAHLRLQCRHLQVALCRVCATTGEKVKAGQKVSSVPSSTSSPARRASVATEEEPQAENQPADDDDQVTPWRRSSTGDRASRRHREDLGRTRTVTILPRPWRTFSSGKLMMSLCLRCCRRRSWAGCSCVEPA